MNRSSCDLQKLTKNAIASFLLITSLVTSTNGQTQMHTTLCEDRPIDTETSLFTSIGGQTHMHTHITNNITMTDPNHRNQLRTQSAPRGENNVSAAQAKIT